MKVKRIEIRMFSLRHWLRVTDWLSDWLIDFHSSKGLSDLGVVYRDKSKAPNPGKLCPIHKFHFLSGSAAWRFRSLLKESTKSEERIFFFLLGEKRGKIKYLFIWKFFSPQFSKKKNDPRIYKSVANARIKIVFRWSLLSVSD